ISSYLDSKKYFLDIPTPHKITLTPNGHYATDCAHQLWCDNCSDYGPGAWRPNGILACFNGAGERLWASYYGSSTTTVASTGTTIYSLASDGNGNLFFGGGTSSTISIATPGSHQETYGGGTTDCFLGKFI